MISEEAHVASECQTIQEALSENRGEVVRLSAAERRHVDACPACAEVAAAERALGFIFREAVPPADPSVVAGVMAALRPVRTWRRVVAFVPVAASLLLDAVGALPGVRSMQSTELGNTLNVIDIGVALPALLGELQRQGARLLTLTTHQATLEDVFVHLTGRMLRDD